MINEKALLAYVLDEPETATQIYRRYAGLHERKTLTTKLRNERRAVAIKLEEMARRGTIRRGQGDAQWHPVPTYSLWSPSAERAKPTPSAFEQKTWDPRITTEVRLQPPETSAEET